jgi:hypothetical protein
VTLGPRERRLLAGLAGALALAVVVRLAGRDAAGPAAGEVAARRAVAGAEAPAVREVVDLDVASLLPTEGGHQVGRDPFRFGALPPPPPPPPEPPRPPAPAPTYVEVVPRPPPPPPVPTPPSPDHLRFLGIFGPANRRIAVVNTGEEIHNVTEGAVLEGRFVVQQIGFESVAITFVGFPQEPPRRLPVGGQ